MKKNIQLLLIIVIASHFAACKSKDKQPQTTIEKIQARWTLESQVENEHISGQDNITNISGTAADVIEFRKDGNVYSDVMGTKDTSTYVLSGDTKIILDGTETFDIKTLSSNSFVLYNKEIFGADDYDEVTISLKR